MALKLGAQIDKIFGMDQIIRSAEGKIKDLKRARAELETKLLRSFDKEDIDGCKGKRGVASIKKARFPSIKDRRKFDKYVLRNKALDLFHNRISSKAYFDRLEDGEVVPGVEVFERIGVSIKKRGG